jgi:hypothetical protein
MKPPSHLWIAVAILLVVTVGIVFFARTPGVVETPLVYKTSIPLGDLIPDQRTPEEACSSYLPSVQEKYAELMCNLESSEQVAPTEEDAMERCVDGMSVAGCFVCIFECE